jgi:hypothetical protein
MHLAPRHPEGEPDRRPSDEPPPEVQETPERHPIIGFYTRGAFYSTQTGRWERLAGGQDEADEPAAERDERGGS